jgi:hypothetical protein
MIELTTQRILKIQVFVALIAVAITAFSVFQLSPLMEKQAQLKTEIQVLEAKRTELQRDNLWLAQAAKPVHQSSPKNTEAWIYVGRTSGGQWAPAAEGVAPHTYSLQSEFAFRFVEQTQHRAFTVRAGQRRHTHINGALA